MGKTVAQALRWAGAQIVVHDDEFTQDTGDPVWLTRAGHEGWAIVTKDKAIRYNPLEKRAIVEAKVRCFVLVAGNMTRFDMARALMIALPTMDRAARKNQPPFIARINSNGKVTKTLYKRDLA
jgi:hypothetical protein